VKAYADRIGADYICQQEPILKIRPGPKSNRSKEAVERLGYLPIYEKENAFDYLIDYDQILIIDSDVYVRPTADDSIFDMDENCPFGAVAEREMPITNEYKRKILNYSKMQYHGLGQRMDFSPNSLGYEFFNMGVMLLNKSLDSYLKGQTAREFLQRPMWQPFIDGIGPWKWSTDQTLLNTWLKIEQMPVKHLHWKWNGLFMANTRIKDCEFVHFFLKDKLPAKGENVQELMRVI